MPRQKNKLLKSRDEIINEILGSVRNIEEAALKLRKYGINLTNKQIRNYLLARQGRARRPLHPNLNGTASNEIGDGDGGVNNEIGTYIIQKTYTTDTLTAPSLRPLDYSNYIKFPIIESKPNKFPASVKLSLSQRAGTDFNTSVKTHSGSLSNTKLQTEPVKIHFGSLPNTKFILSKHKSEEPTLSSRTQSHKSLFPLNFYFTLFKNLVSKRKSKKKIA